MSRAALLAPWFALILLAGAATGCHSTDAPPAVERTEPRHDRERPRCGICEAAIEKSYVSLGDGFDYHTACWDSAPRCEGCGLPATGRRGPGSRWRDGRVTCAVCQKEAVLDAADANRALGDARALLRETLALDLGKIDVPLRLVSKDELMAQAAEVGQPAIKALTIVREEGPARDGTRGARTYRMLALYGLPRPALMAILGHELFHVLQVEATADERDAAFREGSANYIQVALLRARGEGVRARLLDRDTDPIYGEGLRRFEKLVKVKGEKEALRFGLRSIAFPEGF